MAIEAACNPLSAVPGTPWYKESYSFKKPENGDNPILTYLSIVYCQQCDESLENPRGPLSKRIFCLEEVLIKHLSGVLQVVKWLESSKKFIQEIATSIKWVLDFTSNSFIWLLLDTMEADATAFTLICQACLVNRNRIDTSTVELHSLLGLSTLGLRSYWSC